MGRGMEVVLATLACWLVVPTRPEELVLSVNVKRPLALVSERFLSITLDPAAMFGNDVLSNAERSTSMASALAPAYVRLGGPRSNQQAFERGPYPQKPPRPDRAFSETHWIRVHKWAERAGLDVIACIAAQPPGGGRFWDSRNALELISFSDQMGYNTSWQLGYECQSRCDASGSELGREVHRLRAMLDMFPRYASSLVVGPDVLGYRTRPQQQYLQEYFGAAGPALGAVTWHPDFAGISIEVEGVSMHHDNLAAEKDNFYKIAGRQITKKPLWIAESKPEECKQQFLGALVWARRLGNSAKLGIQVLMRQPDKSDLFKPTPDYWVSMLHKMLVGREVLDARIATGNRSHVSFYSHCTRPSSRYERGSLTIFGVNLTPDKIVASVKNLKPKVVHKYILLPGFEVPNRMFAETTLLNNELLTLVGGKEVPIVQPVVYSAEKGVKLKLPSGGIGFWVLPGLKIKTCMEHEDETADNISPATSAKWLEEAEAENEPSGEDNANRESPEPKSEEQKPRQQLQKRSPPRRPSRQDNEPGELRKARVNQLELAKRDLEKLDRILRRLGRQPAKRKNEGIYGIFNDTEEESNSDEDGILGKSIADLKLDEYGKEIRSKLQKYKKLLDQETKKKPRVSANSTTTERAKDDQATSSNKGIDTEKVIEALTLITKVENALRSLERGDYASSTQTGNLTPALGSSNDLTLAQQRSDRGSDALLDEVLRSEKSKRTSVPTGIEDQLKALYQLLSEEKDRKDNESRQRRDLDQQLEDGLRGDSRRRSKQTKERRQELRQRRRERQEQRRLREQQQQKQDEPLGSSEEEEEEKDFHGFQTQLPLENFPVGDVYADASIDSMETKAHPKDQPQASKAWTATPIKVPIFEKENVDTRAERVQIGHVPDKFYENETPTGHQIVNVNMNTMNHGDLWKHEPLNKNENNEKRIESIADNVNHEIITEKPVLVVVNRKVEEQTRQQPVNYYRTVPEVDNYNFEALRPNPQQIQYQPQAMPNYYQNTAPGSNVYTSDQVSTAFVNANGYYTHPSGYVPSGQSSFRRTKRHVKDLESVLHQEMLTQDDNNLKDCQCRVIRGVEECKDCILQQDEQIAPLVIRPVPTFQNPLSNIYDEEIRPRRDTEETVIVNENIETTEKNEDITTTSRNEDIVESTTEYKAIDNQKVEQIEEVEEKINTERSLQNSNETTSIEDSTTANIKDQLNLEYASDQLLGNRLPRTVGAPSKYFLKTKATTTLQSIENLKNDTKINNGSNDNPSSTKTQLIAENESQITDEHVARFVKNTTDQISNKPSSKDKIKLSKEKINLTPSVQIEDSTFNSNIDVSASPKSVDKSLGSDLDIKEINKRAVKDSNSERKAKQVAKSQANGTSVLNNSTSVDNTTDIKPKSSILQNSNKTKSTLQESKNKLKNNTDDLAKPRQARLTSRTDALGALRKENESRRAKKMFETSLKIIDNESAKFEEYQRKRREQLEKLKLKLRAKRDKMLQQYRAELLEAINEDVDTKPRNIRRRDLTAKYHDSDVDTKTYNSYSDGEKLAYIMRYKPIKYVTREENEKYIPLIEVIKPYHETRRKQVLSNRCSMVETDGDSNHKITENKRKGSPINIHFEDEIYNDQEYQSTNRKRSPYLWADEFGVVRRYDYRVPHSEYERLQEDSREYDNQPLQVQYRPAQYYPQIDYNRGVAPGPYDANYYDIHPAYKQQNYPPNYKNIASTLKQSDLTDNENSTESVSDSNKTQEELQKSEQQQTVLQQPEQSQTEIQEPQQQPEQQDLPLQPQEQQKLQHEIQSMENNPKINRPNNYPSVQYELVKPNYRKVRRSNLKIFEVDPSMYEEEDRGYDLPGLYLKPSYRFSARSFRHDPYEHVNNRYKREATFNQKSTINEPLSFSLGLEKSKMKQIKEEFITSPDFWIRRKRLVEDPSNTNKSPLKKNIKKVLKNVDDKNKKFPKSLQYVRSTDKNLDISSESSNEQNTEIIGTFDEDATQIKNSNINNHLYNQEMHSIKRQKRSIDTTTNDHQVTNDNGINRIDDPEMDEIWHNIIDMKQDEKLLKEYDKQKSMVINNYRETQRSLQKYLELAGNPLEENENLPIAKSADSTTQTNIESILVDTIPKIETVITKGLKKAENLTGSFEDFIENFEENFEENFDESTKTPETSNESKEMDDGKFGHNIFRAMIRGVKKFFDLISGITRTFQNQ